MDLFHHNMFLCIHAQMLYNRFNSSLDFPLSDKLLLIIIIFSGFPMIIPTQNISNLVIKLRSFEQLTVQAIFYDDIS